MDKDILEAMEKEGFVKKCDLENFKGEVQNDILKTIDQPCSDTKTCALHGKIDEIKKEALIKGLAIGKVTNRK